MNIGNKIIELRKKNNLTQERLSEIIGVSRQTLSSWESNITSPNLDQAKLLSKELKISLDELANNELDIVCKDYTNHSILNDLVGKICIFELSELSDICVLYNEKVKVLEVNTDFIKVEITNGKKTSQKLIDIDLIKSINCIGEE